MTAQAAQHERAAWLRLVLTPGVGPRTARHLLSTFGLPGEIFGAGRPALARAVPDALATVLAQPPSAAIVESIAATERWLAAGERNALLTLADAGYPQLLLNTDDPPPVLFACGRLDLLSQPAVAIVGSRNATRQGAANAEAFAGALVHAGYAVISGLALGIDAAAHHGALDAEGATIAVVGTGIDVVYPARHLALTQRIRQHGLVLSEFALGTPAMTHNFPRRNRILAGLARGVLVVEAALRSGSLITARLAAETGREVFAVPGSIHSPLSKGCHRLIRDGAKLVESAQDILDELGGRSIAVDAKDTVPDAGPHTELLALIGHDPIGLDQLAALAQRDAGELAAALLELELTQDVERLPGNRYQRLR